MQGDLHTENWLRMDGDLLTFARPGGFLNLFQEEDIVGLVQLAGKFTNDRIARTVQGGFNEYWTNLVQVKWHGGLYHTVKILQSHEVTETIEIIEWRLDPDDIDDLGDIDQSIDHALDLINQDWDSIETVDGHLTCAIQGICNAQAGIRDRLEELIA